MSTHRPNPAIHRAMTTVALVALESTTLNVSSFSSVVSPLTETVTCLLVSPGLNLSVLFEEYRAVVPGLENARDVLGTVSVRGVNGWRVQISGEVGLSSGAPDHAFMLGASRRF